MEYKYIMEQFNCSLFTSQNKSVNTPRKKPVTIQMEGGGVLGGLHRALERGRANKYLCLREKRTLFICHHHNPLHTYMQEHWLTESTTLQILSWVENFLIQRISSHIFDFDTFIFFLYPNNKPNFVGKC